MNDVQIAQALKVLQRQFFQLVEPHQLRWPEEKVLKSSDVQSWIYTHMFNTSTIQSPPPDRYQLRLLKLLVSKLERSIEDPEEDVRLPISSLLSYSLKLNTRSYPLRTFGVSLLLSPLTCIAYKEISDDLMGAMSNLLTSNVPSEADSAQQKVFVTYSYPHHATDDTSADRTVALLEARSVISSSGTTGLRTWEAALLLGSYLVSEKGQSTIRGKRLFELGAGTGMLSILCAKHLGIAGIVSTDGDEAVVDAIKTNIFLNGLQSDDISGCPIRTAALKWGYPLERTTFSEDYGMEAPDVLFGADVTYDKSVIPRLVSTMWEFFELNPALQVMISATIRNEQTFETFLNACRRNHFSFEQIDFLPVPEHLQDGPFYPTSTPIQIWRITRAQSSTDPFALQ